MMLSGVFFAIIFAAGIKQHQVGARTTVSIMAAAIYVWRASHSDLQLLLSLNTIYFQGVFNKISFYNWQNESKVNILHAPLAH
jgi:hypothetical protein